jgi:alanine dehydrogenase
MNKTIKVAVLKETKTPPDRRAALSPQQCLDFIKAFPNTELYIQSSQIRAFKDQEYIDLGLKVVDDVRMCDVLIGIKEVHIPELIEGKTYMFFSHTAKEQKYNRPLLQEFLKKNIKMIDYEYLTDKTGMRLVAFGSWAGLVGAYNGLIAYGKRSGLFDLKRACDCHDTKEICEELKRLRLPAIKILITGGGRVAGGAEVIMNEAGIQKISPEEFLDSSKTYPHPVYAQLDPQYYVERTDGEAFDLQHFFRNPKAYRSTFKPFLKQTDLYIACHFWDEHAPRFFDRVDLLEPDNRIRVVADVSCDIDGPIPSTLRASKIADPFYGYDPRTGQETDAFNPNAVTVMAIDNLPGEVPRDASCDFSQRLIEKVFPALFGEDTEGIIERATITEKGRLGNHFQYLMDFAEGRC